MNRWEKVKIFFMGALLTLGLMLFLGAKPASTVAAGRYQVSACATQHAEFCYMVDSHTGKIWVTTREKTWKSLTNPAKKEK